MADDSKPPIVLNRLDDPERGIQLLSQAPSSETPEQRTTRLFWLFQFQMQIDWKAGDLLAPAKALDVCESLGKPPPRWLVEAVLAVTERNLSDAERRQFSDLLRHMSRWRAVKRRHDRGDVSWEVAYEETAAMSRGTGFEGEADTMAYSYKLIQAAGGENATLVTYRRALAHLRRGN